MSPVNQSLIAAAGRTDFKIAAKLRLPGNY
jgi:hypothetical protein